MRKPPARRSNRTGHFQPAVGIGQKPCGATRRGKEVTTPRRSFQGGNSDKRSPASSSAVRCHVGTHMTENASRLR